MVGLAAGQASGTWSALDPLSRIVVTLICLHGQLVPRGSRRWASGLPQPCRSQCGSTGPSCSPSGPRRAVSPVPATHTPSTAQGQRRRQAQAKGKSPNRVRSGPPHHEPGLKKDRQSRPLLGRLFPEQVRVAPGAGELHLVAFDPVEQKPVRFDMQVAEAVPVAPKGMVPVFTVLFLMVPVFTVLFLGAWPGLPSGGFVIPIRPQGQIVPRGSRRWASATPPGHLRSRCTSKGPPCGPPGPWGQSHTRQAPFPAPRASAGRAGRASGSLPALGHPKPQGRTTDPDSAAHRKGSSPHPPTGSALDQVPPVGDHTMIPALSPSPSSYIITRNNVNQFGISCFLMEQLGSLPDCPALKHILGAAG